MTNHAELLALADEMRKYADGLCDLLASPNGGFGVKTHGAVKDWANRLRAIAAQPVGLPELPFSPYLVSEWTGPDMIDRSTWTAYNEDHLRDYAARAVGVSLGGWSVRFDPDPPFPDIAVIVDPGGTEEVFSQGEIPVLWKFLAAISEQAGAEAHKE
jgi:hypothetical protein